MGASNFAFGDTQFLGAVTLEGLHRFINKSATEECAPGCVRRFSFGSIPSNLALARFSGCTGKIYGKIPAFDSTLAWCNNQCYDVRVSKWGSNWLPGIAVEINQTISLCSISHRATSVRHKLSSTSSSGLCKSIRHSGSCVVVAVVVKPCVAIKIPPAWKITGCKAFTYVNKVLLLLFEQRG